MMHQSFEGDEMKSIRILAGILSLVSATTGGCDAAGGGDSPCTAELVPVLRVTVQCDDGPEEAGGMVVQYKLASSVDWSNCSVESSGGGPARCVDGGSPVTARCERLTPRGAEGIYVVQALQGTRHAESSEVAVAEDECHAQTQQVVLQLAAGSE